MIVMGCEQLDVGIVMGSDKVDVETISSDTILEYNITHLRWENAEFIFS